MILTRIVFILSIIIVFVLSIVNSSDISFFENLSFLSDKAIHGIIYFYLTFMGIICKFRISNFALFLLIFIFGFSFEIIHLFHPNRFFEYYDLLANLIGGTIALLINMLKI